MKHKIVPTSDLRPQLRAAGFTEPYKRDRVVLYRFFSASGDLLYVGITVRPMDRWQQHKATAGWWPMVDHVAVEWHGDERSALDAEVAAIRSERPLFNIRSASGDFMRSAAIPPTLLMRNVPLSLSRSRRRSLSRSFCRDSQDQGQSVRHASAIGLGGHDR